MSEDTETLPVTEDGESSPLAELATKANEEHRAAQEAARSALEHARAAGEALNDAKGHVDHGEWGTWLEEKFEASPRTARLYMRVARNWSKLEAATENGNALPIREAAGLLSEGGRSDDTGDQEDLGTLRDRVEFTPTGLRLPDDLSFEEWKDVQVLIQQQTTKVTRRVLHAGLKLISAQHEMDREEFNRMVEEDLPFGPKLTRRICAIACDDRILGTPVRDLPADVEVLYKLTRLDETEWSYVEPHLSPFMKPGDIKSILLKARHPWTGEAA